MPNPSNPNLFRGTRLRLTSLTRDDAPAIAAWYLDSEFARLYDSNPAYPRDEASIAASLESQGKDPNAVLFGIRLLDDDALIGDVRITEIEWSNQVAGLSIGIGERNKWSRGYGREAMELVLAFAFRELNLRRVQLTVFDYNERAIALYERLGFRREGVFREFGQRDGERYDMYLYGLLRREWESTAHLPTES